MHKAVRMKLLRKNYNATDVANSLHTGMLTLDFNKKYFIHRAADTPSERPDNNGAATAH